MSARWNLISGPLVPFLTVAGIALVDRYFVPVPNPGAISVIAVVFAAYQGGIGPGLVSAAVSVGYSAIVLSTAGQLWHLGGDHLARLMVAAFGQPLIAVMVGWLRQRELQALSRERRGRARSEEANDELIALREALDRVDYGVVLL